MEMCCLFTKRQNVRHLQTQSIYRQQNKCDWKVKICSGKGRKHCGKRRKCWKPAFSPFNAMISNDRGLDCAGKSQLLSKQQNSRLLQIYSIYK